MDTYRSNGQLPLMIYADENPAVDALEAWLLARKTQLREMLLDHGAIWLRGFDVTEAEDFERIARTIDDELKNEYMGLSPRIPLTPYVFTTLAANLRVLAARQGVRATGATPQRRGQAGDALHLR